MCVRYNSGIEYVQECGKDDAVAASYMSNVGTCFFFFFLSSLLPLCLPPSLAYQPLVNDMLHWSID